MDISKLVLESRAAVRYAKENAGDIVLYKPEFLIIDILKALERLTNRKHAITVEVECKVVREEKGVEKIVSFLKTFEKLDEVEVEVEMGRVRHAFTLTHPMLYDQGRQIMEKLFEKLKLKKKFEKLYTDTTTNEMMRFLELINLMKEAVTNELEKNMKKN